MSVKLPNGTLVFVASAYATLQTISAITNATEAVATLPASHGIVVGDFVEVTSGWSGLNGRVCRIKAVSTNDVTLEGIDTSDTVRFVSGAGVGSLRKVSTFTQLTQTQQIDVSGGDATFVTFSFLEDPDNEQQQIPDAKTPKSYKVTMADDASLPWFPVLQQLDAAKSPYALKLVLPSGSVICANAFVSFNDTPTLTASKVMAVVATFSAAARQVRYAM